MLRVAVLGELRLEVDGREVPPPASWRARSVLGWMALHPGRHSRMSLAARFWPEILESSARASLRNALWSLRRAVGEDVLDAGRETVALADDVWVDAAEFSRLVTAGEDEAALALCRGDLLEGLDDDWVLEARDEHRARVAALLERMAGAAEARGEPAEALGLTRRWAALDRTAEPAQRELIRRLAAAGDRSAALGAYRRLSDRLRVELSMAPSAETRALVESLRLGGEEAEPADESQAAATALPPRLAAEPASRFVGRETELDRLQALWRDAIDAPGARVAVIAGEPGIGKSRLAREFAVRAHAGGARVLHGVAHEEAAVPYEPLVEMLGGHAGVLAPSDEGLMQERFSAVAGHLRDRAPALLVLDDIQWADGATARLLGFLLRAQRLPRTLVLATLRPGELRAEHPLDAVLAGARREGCLHRIDLQGLGDEEIAQLAGDAGAASGGNPLFALELRRARESGDEALPEGVRDIVRRTLARLGTGVSRRLEVAAVLGQEFDLDLLERLSADEEGEFIDELEQALGAGLLEEVPGPAERCSFTHAVMREALLETVSGARRRRIHAAAAAALAHRSHDRSAGQIVHHLAEAGPLADPADLHAHAVQAGALARAQHAYDEEASFYGWALAALPEDAESARRELKIRRLVALQALTHLAMDVRARPG